MTRGVVVVAVVVAAAAAVAMAVAVTAEVAVVAVLVAEVVAVEVGGALLRRREGRGRRGLRRSGAAAATGRPEAGSASPACSEAHVYRPHSFHEAVCGALILPNR